MWQTTPCCPPTNQPPMHTHAQPPRHRKQTPTHPPNNSHTATQTTNQPIPTHRRVTPARAVSVALLATRRGHGTGQPNFLAAADACSCSAVGCCCAVDATTGLLLQGCVDVDAGSTDCVCWQGLLVWHVGDGDVPVVVGVWVAVINGSWGRKTHTQRNTTVSEANTSVVRRTQANTHNQHTRQRRHPPPPALSNSSAAPSQHTTPHPTRLNTSTPLLTPCEPPKLTMH